MKAPTAARGTRRCSLAAVYTTIFFCTALTVDAQVPFTKLVDFDGVNGSYPTYGTLVQGVDGNLYGTTSAGGSGNAGTIFRMTPAGALTTLYNFCTQPKCIDGSNPEGGLTVGPDGNMYGTTSSSGPHGGGTVYKISLDGTFSTLYGFCARSNCTDGGAPYAAPVLGFDGNFYGTTHLYGAHWYAANTGGTIYKITPSGKLTTIYSFCAQADCTDGQLPIAGLAQGSNGEFYGTTTGGCCGSETNGFGNATIFEIAPSGAFALLATFGLYLEGANPVAGLALGQDGNLYGIAWDGGVIFKTTLGGTTTVLSELCPVSPCPDGNLPTATLEWATDGKFYGTTSSYGSTSNAGTIFRVTRTGTVTLLHQFQGAGDGSEPEGGLFQATSGDFYGTATYGGIYKSCAKHCGTVFRLSFGFPPFIRTVQRAGKAGSTIIILGNGLAGSSAVTFDGTMALFTVVSNTEITAVVPASATSGRIQVVTPGGVLSTDLVFHIL